MYKEYRDKKGCLHRIDGPAVIHHNGESWYLHGKQHRIDGPALIDYGYKKYTWYVNGWRMDDWEQFKYEAELSDEEVMVLALIWEDKGPKPVKLIRNN